MDVSKLSTLQLSSLSQQHLLWHACRELLGAVHLALKSDSEMNFLLLQ